MDLVKYVIRGMTFISKALLLKYIQFKLHKSRFLM